MKLFLLSGFVGLMSFFYYPVIVPGDSRRADNPVWAESRPKPIKQNISGKPVRLIIPSADIDIPVKDGVYNSFSQTWSSESKTAQYAVDTSPANDTAGNTFIYGHNNRYVFQNLLKVKSGEEAIVETKQGYRFTYEFNTSFDVEPNQVEAITHDGAPILTLQTCVGPYYEQRRMFRFDFVSVEKKQLERQQI